MNKTKGFFALLITGFIYSTLGVYARVLNQTLLPSQQIFLRYITGFLLVSIFMLFAKIPFTLKKISWPILTIYAISFPLNVVLFTIAVTQIKIALVGFSFYLTSIILSLLLGIFIFHEKITQLKTITIVLAIAGLICFTVPFNNNPALFGIILCLIGGCCDAIANASRKYLAKDSHRFTLVNVQMIGAIFVAIVFGVLSHQPFLPTTITSISVSAIITLILFGLSIIAVSYLTLIGFGNFDLNFGTIVLASELIFSVILGYLLYHEVLTFNEIIGAIFVGAAIILANIPKKKTKRAL